MRGEDCHLEKLGRSSGKDSMVLATCSHHGDDQSRVQARLSRGGCPNCQDPGYRFCNSWPLVSRDFRLTLPLLLRGLSMLVMAAVGARSILHLTSHRPTRRLLLSQARPLRGVCTGKR